FICDFFFFSSRRRHTRFSRDWSSDVCSSDLVPTYPGRISLALEPLVIRRKGFSPFFRYSCLHSHSHSLHHSITRQLHRPHDAPLPNTTPQPHTHQGCRLGYTWYCHNFGGVLKPRYIIGAESLDQ